VGSPPSALGLLEPARGSWAARAARNARLAMGATRWPDLLRASAAVLLSALDGAWAAALRPALAGPLALLGAAGVLGALAGTLARRFVPVGVGLVLLGAEYLASEAGRPVSVAVAAAYGTVLLAVAELAWWSVELSARSSWARSELRRRWALLGGLLGGAFAASVVVGAVGIARLRPPGALAGAGVVGALVVAFAVTTWVREISRPPAGPGPEGAGATSMTAGSDIDLLPPGGTGPRG